MATLTASSNSSLKAALSKAKPGDTIKLSAGNYGSIDLNGGTGAGSHLKFKGTVTIASDPDKAVFTGVGLSYVSNLKFQGVKFDGNGSSKFYAQNSSNLTFQNVTFDGAVSGGYGKGTGLDIRKSTNVTVQDSDFTTLDTGLRFNGGGGHDVLNNDFSRISYNGITLGSVDHVLVSGNHVDMDGRPGLGHKDAFQVVNGGGVPGSNIVVRSNIFESEDGMTHGIYLGNQRAKQTGNIRDFYKDIVIENNKVYGGQQLGIALGETDGAVVRGNTVLRHHDMDSTKAINLPVIRFADGSRDVTITGNVTYENPGAANNNWQLTGAKNSSWTISGNKIVSKSVQGSSGQQSSISVAVTVEEEDAPSAPEAPAGTGGDGDADAFRFFGDELGGGRTSTVRGLDFGEGDTLTFLRYDAGTFKAFGGGNPLEANRNGDYVKLDSIADLKELDQASGDVSLGRSGDTVTLSIDQGSATHRVVLEHLADAFLL
jgi:hypothetical protein